MNKKTKTPKTEAAPIEMNHHRLDVPVAGLVQPDATAALAADGILEMIKRYAPKHLLVDVSEGGRAFADFLASHGIAPQRCTFRTSKKGDRILCLNPRVLVCSPYRGRQARKEVNHPAPGAAAGGAA